MSKKSVGSGAQLCHQGHSFYLSTLIFLSQLILKVPMAAIVPGSAPVMTVLMPEKNVSFCLTAHLKREEKTLQKPHPEPSPTISLVMIVMGIYTFLDPLTK